MAYPDFDTATFTTGLASANTYTDFDLTIGVNRILGVKLLITPSIVGSNNRFLLFQTAARDGVRAFSTKDFNGNLIVPMADSPNGPTEQGFGPAFIYIDYDLTGKLHFRMHNNHNVGQTYTVEIHWYELPA